MTRNRKYSNTVYFISYDSSDNSRGQQGKRFKYSYEEFNADSNLIYQEVYANNTDHFGDMWGKLMQEATLFYSGKLKIKETIEIKIAYISPEGGGNKGSYTYTYKYAGQNLSKLFYDSKPVEEYLYDKNNNQIERRIINKLNIPEYYQFTYHDKLRIKAQHFVADTVIGIDTFIYDKNRRHIQTISQYENGKMADTIINRDTEGQIIEKKWRIYFQSYSGYPFYNMNKYFYDNRGRLLKKEYFLNNKLKTVYEFEYN